MNKEGPAGQEKSSQTQWGMRIAAHGLIQGVRQKARPFFIACRRNEVARKQNRFT